MKTAEKPLDESARLRALKSYDVLDTATEQAYDDLTELAAEICGTPIALISLVDSGRQWFKSHHGLDVRETPRDVAFCAHAILEQEFFEVSDAYADERFADNPLVTDAPGVVFYAGACLTNPAGHNIGTLCVIDHKPRRLNNWQRRCLLVIARQVISLLELRKAIRERREAATEKQKSLDLVKRQRNDLAQFAYRSSHDLRAPAIQIQNLTQLLREDLEAGRDEEVARTCGLMTGISEQLVSFIDGIVEVGRADLVGSATQIIDYDQLINEAIVQAHALVGDHGVDVRYSIHARRQLRSQYLRLRQLLVHLITNGIRFHSRDRANPFVDIRVSDTDDGIELVVADNGIGIPPLSQPDYFDLFSRFHPDVCAGSGVGTTIVKKHATAVGADVSLHSDDEGTTVTVNLPKGEDG